MKDFLAVMGCLVAIGCLWVLPIVLGVKAANRNYRSPRWMWFGVHPFGAWVAYLLLRFLPPGNQCPACGAKAGAGAKFCPSCANPFTDIPGGQSVPPHGGKLKWVLVVLGIVLGLGGFSAFLFTTVNSAFKENAAYQEALTRCKADQRVIQLLGTPIQEGSFSSGSISTTGDASGSADLSIPINGPKGSARLYASSTLKAGVWTFQVLEVAPQDGKPRINLLDPPKTDSSR